MPKVFISYSWEGEDHKDWVRHLTDSLLKNSIDATLDQYDLTLGDRLPQFMEQAISDADYVLVICTPIYKEKSDARKGGVGYEGHIISGELFSKGSERKFIPVIRKGTVQTAIPTSLLGKLGIDLRDGPHYESNFNDLLTTLQGKKTKPPDLSKVGTIQDLLCGINKLLEDGSRQDESVRASAMVEKHLASQAKSQANNLIKLGTMSLNAGNVEKGIRQFEEAIRIDSNNVGAYIGLVRAVDKEKCEPYIRQLKTFPFEEVEAWLRANPEMLDTSNSSLLLIDSIITKTISASLLKELLNAGANPTGTYSLHYAIISDHSGEMAKLLLESGANPNIEYTLTFRDSSEVRSPLADVVWQTRNVKFAKIMIDFGADVNFMIKSCGSKYPSTNGQWPVIDMAIRTNNLPMVQLLIDNGAKCNITYDVQNIIHYTILTETRSPLSSAICFSNDIKIMQAILENGANPEIKYEEDIYWYRDYDSDDPHKRKVMSLLELAKEKDNKAAVSILSELFKKRQEESEIAFRIQWLKSERSILENEISNANGLFTSNRRKRAQKKLEEYETALIEVEEGKDSEFVSTYIDAKENRKKSTKIIIIAIIIAVILLGTIEGIRITNERNEKISNVQSYLSEQTLSCSFSEWKLFSRHEYNYVLKFNGDGTIRYYYSTGNRNPEYQNTYTYQISYKDSTSYIITVNGKQFVLTVNDNNIPEKITYND